MSHDWRFEAIGTTWSIRTPEPLVAETVEAVSARIEDYDRRYSRFRSDSTISALARNGGSAELGPEAAPLFALYERIGALTDGAVTPLIGGSLEALGYGADYRLVAGPPRPAPPGGLRLDGDTITLDAPATVDIGAAGKGQLVDLIAELLRDAGVHEATVDASGDLRHDGTDPIDVALEHPYDPERAIGIARLGGPDRRAIAGSAANRRTWGDGLHHVLDGRTGLPVQTVVATWAIAADAMVADALATALFFVPGGVIDAEFDADWIRVLSDGRFEASPAAAAGLFA